MTAPSADVVSFISSAAASGHRWVLVHRTPEGLGYKAAKEEDSVNDLIASIAKDESISLYDLHAPLGPQLANETYWAQTEEEIAPWIFKLSPKEAYTTAVSQLERAQCKQPHTYLRRRLFELLETAKSFDTVRETEQATVDMGDGGKYDLECLLFENRIEGMMDEILDRGLSLESLQSIYLILSGLDEEFEHALADASIAIYPVTHEPPQWTFLLSVQCGYRVPADKYEALKPDLTPLMEEMRKSTYETLNRFSSEQQADLVLSALTFPSVVMHDAFMYTTDEIEAVKKLIFDQQARERAEEEKNPGTIDIEKHYTEESFAELVAQLPVRGVPQQT